ncbi:MAG: Ig-like domain-containing protein [Candidatus Korobacteraceae bacterium]
MQRVSAVSVLAAVAAVLSLSFLVACGGGSSTTGTATQIILTPASISLNEGGVATLSAITEDSAGNAVAADISFTSSNTSVATVSTGGLVCGGQWDSAFIDCNSSGNSSGVGQVTITATATATPSVTATATLYVHEKVDQVIARVGSCTSMGQAVSIYGVALSTSAPGCSVSSPCNITSTVGPFAFGSNNATIAGNNSSGVLTAGQPGTTTVFASVSGVNSVGTPYSTCGVNYIFVHGSGNRNTSFTLSGTATLGLTADVVDTNNTIITPTITWGSSTPAVATVAAGTGGNVATVTAVAPGTTTITASCNFNCNLFMQPQYSLNVATVTVSGGSQTTVYAASTNSKMLVPISTATNQAGTPISLPAIPNSIMANQAGTTLYLGSPFGLMVVDVASGSLTTYAVDGAIIAISPDGTFMLLSDVFTNAIYYFDLATQTLGFGFAATTSSAAYTPDSLAVSELAGISLLNGYPISAPFVSTLTYNPTALDIMAQGGLTYITTTSGAAIDVRSTCSSSRVDILPANAPTLVKALPNGTGAVAADSPNIDVVSTASTLSPGCPVTTPSSLVNYDLGAGAFNAQQLIVSPNSSHAWIISDLPELLSFYLPTFAPAATPYAGGATAFSGGVTSDGTQLYVGTSDGTVHRIAVASNSDVQQIAVGLKDTNGNATPPNLVTVVP